jgi:hypothetical protein
MEALENNGFGGKRKKTQTCLTDLFNWYKDTCDINIFLIRHKAQKQNTI